MEPTPMGSYILNCHPSASPNRHETWFVWHTALPPKQALVSVHALSTQINVHESSWFLIRDTDFIWIGFTHALLQML